MIEIERKFLVTSSAYRDLAYKSYRIVQGFLSRDPDRTVRIRLTDDKGVLTVKGRSSEDGLKRFEWEREISKGDAEELLNICLPGTIDKMRYLVKQDNHIFEVDEFYGDNSGLVVAELELEDEHVNFKSPDWLGKEVTGNNRYYNSHLSEQPYKTWKI